MRVLQRYRNGIGWISQKFCPLFRSIAIVFLVTHLSFAQTLPPITPSGLNTQVSAPVILSGGETQHNITGGTRPDGGGNLFHSFGEFGVPTNNIANFLNDAALPTNNILSRVTGGNPSNIFGTIQTTGFESVEFGNANLFLMNPAGIVFGPNATLNVSGSTHFTTADYLKLADGLQFTAHLPSAQDAVLNVYPVVAFGFLESIPAPITVNGSTLSVNNGQAISLVGGDVTIGSGLKSTGGQVAIASVASPGEVLADTFARAPNVNGQTFTTMGNISLLEDAILDVSGDAAGSVVIRGGELIMTNARISADTIDSHGVPTAIDVNLTGDLSISTVDGPALTARTSGTGNAGEIHIVSDNMNVSGTGFSEFIFPVIDTHTSGAGNAGGVVISTQADLIVTGDPFSSVFFIDSGTEGLDVGTGGDINISARDVELNNSTISSGNALNFFKFFGEGTGRAGNINISSEKLKLDFFSSILSSSQNFLDETGKGGNIAITATAISLVGFSELNSSGGEQSGAITFNTEQMILDDSNVFALTSLMPGGGITITGTVIELDNGSSLVTSTTGNGHAGPIIINASQRLGLLRPSFSDSPSGIFSNSLGFFGNLGNSGDIIINAPVLEMVDGGRINARTGTSGRGGDVIINSQLVSISGEIAGQFPEPIFSLGAIQPSGIFTGSELGNCSGPCGDAGNVSLTTDSLLIGNGGQINSGTNSSGAGGDLTINARETVSITGALSDGSSAGILSRTIGTDPDAGRGGNIDLTAGESFSLGNGATVSASSNGPANAGNIQLTATDTILIDGATVTTEAAQASGGNIKLTAQDLIRLNDSTISSSVQGSATTVGGDISLDPDFIILQNSRILAKAVEGQGGNISLIANNAVLVDPLSVLDASSALGVSGSVDIQAPIQNLSGTLAPLPEETVPVTALYGARCAAGSGGHFSTFVDSKAGSLSPTPGAFLASPLLNLSASAHGVADRSASQQSSVILTASIAPLVLGHAGEPTTACP